METVLIRLLLILTFAPLLPGVIVKTRAFFAGRRGAPLWQVYFDLYKLLRKGCVYSPTTTWIFRASPMAALTVFLVAGLLVPMPGWVAIEFWGDALLFVYLLALARFVFVLAALDTGSSFEGMGASREATFACLCEVALFFALTALAFLSHSLSLTDMASNGAAYVWSSSGPAVLLISASLFLILLTENARIPVDDPATHLELTMVHEVMVLDHSGVDLGYILYGKAVKLFVLSALLVSVVLPLNSFGSWAGTGLFALGMTGVAVAIGVVESTMARLRLNRVSYLLILAFILAVFGFIVALLR